MKTLIESDGAKAALTPATQNFDKERLVSLWSHKHLGHLIGLGRYGTNCQFIGHAGFYGRLRQVPGGHALKFDVALAG